MLAAALSLTGIVILTDISPSSSTANAATISMPYPYAELKTRLSSNDANTRITARRLLGANFQTYQDEAITDLFSKNDNVDYTVSLLHGLIAGIDNATGGQLSPGQPRDLSSHLPFVPASRLNDLVALTGNTHEEIQKQALRLVQRFPVDDFKTIYDRIEGRAGEEDCKKLSDTDKLIRWGAIFFYYNRIVQFMYTAGPLSPQSSAEIDALTSAGMKGTKCLSEEKRVDGAALYFARSVVFDHLKQAAGSVLAEVKSFDAYVDKFGGASQYYSQSHVETVSDLRKKYTAARQ